MTSRYIGTPTGITISTIGTMQRIRIITDIRTRIRKKEISRKEPRSRKSLARLRASHSGFALGLRTQASHSGFALRLRPRYYGEKSKKNGTGK